MKVYNGGLLYYIEFFYPVSGTYKRVIIYLFAQYICDSLALSLSRS